MEFGLTRNAGLLIMGCCLLEFLCKLHLKDPGCEVGEHKHVRFELCDFEMQVAVFEAME